MNIVNLNIIPALGLQCRFNNLNYLDTVLSVTIAPLAVSLFFGIVYWYRWMVARAYKLKMQEVGGQTIIYLFLLFTFLGAWCLLWQRHY